MAEFVIITGMSGAGRSSVANTLEDLGWFVIDNMPLQLVGKVAELAETPGGQHEQVAFVVGRTASEKDPLALARAIDELRAAGARVRLVFLDAADPVLVRRYEGTRRRHPLAEQEGAGVGIERERAALEQVKALADVVIDTSALNVHELRDRVLELFPPGEHDTMAVNVVSFGFKHGLPGDVDLVLDLRFLPNPHWVEELRPLTGLDQPVRDHVLAGDQAHTFLTKLDDLLAFLVPAYEREGKSYLTIGIGCTGGQHRSVAVAEEVVRRLGSHGVRAKARHRDLARR